MMKRFAHILNPYRAPAQTDMAIAQPIVFESMRRAKANAAGIAEVELLSLTFPEDADQNPPGFRALPFLERDVNVFATFRHRMRLPLIADILDRAYQHSEAEYLIYTNADIILHPDFYKKVAEFAAQAWDAFIINRRRIEARWDKVSQLDEIVAQKGKSHPGFDCFVFRRELVPRFSLAHICIGVPFIEISLSQNLIAFAERFHLFEDEYLTFHLGMEIFRRRAPKEYVDFNRGEYRKLKPEIWPHLRASKFPYARQPLPLRLIRYGLHPCFPIKEMLALEWREGMSLRK